MGLAEWTKKIFTPSRKKQRGFFPAGFTRLTADWATSTGQIDTDLRGDLVALRSRSRELCKSNDYAKKYLRLLIQNVVGSEGFILQVKSYEWRKRKNGSFTKVFDEVANRIIEEQWWKWGNKRWCEITGKLTFRQLCNVAIESVARDGEVLFRKIPNSTVNPHGFTLQIIPADYLDDAYNEELKDGN